MKYRIIKEPRDYFPWVALIVFVAIFLWIVVPGKECRVRSEVPEQQ